MTDNLEDKSLSKQHQDNLNNNDETSEFDDSIEFYLDTDEDEKIVVIEKDIIESKNDNKKNLNETKLVDKKKKSKSVLDNTLYKSSVNDGKYKILVIDDDKWIVRLFKQYLGQWGFTTISASNAFQGLNEAIHHKPLAIFLDILIPEVPGDTLLKFLKRTELITDIPVVIISGNLNKTIIKSTFLSGAAGFLTKPLSQDTLYNKIYEILDEDTYNTMISEGLFVNNSTQQE